MATTLKQSARSRWRVVAGWMLTLALVVMWAMLLRPQVLGGPAVFTRVSGVSMTPTMHTGDLAVAEHRSSYHSGDVIVYRVPAGDPGAGHNIIHRIVGGSGASGFVTRGDHNSYTDPWHPKTSDVIGRVWFHLPGVYTWLGLLRRPLVLAAAVGALTFLLIAWPSDRRQDGLARALPDA